jgi:hypothetical protein
MISGGKGLHYALLSLVARKAQCHRNYSPGKAWFVILPLEGTITTFEDGLRASTPDLILHFDVVNNLSLEAYFIA